ncbi:Protein of unknown function [Methylomagnum ishizawai]|uniref:Glycosyltransferase 61 catalytic domain-containing protein n=1 Tax=Methylomagnum ishizawai TaxID=1760988 RepID=A0A1Y6DBJ4_9GAMM|nr:glycosyltransferase family 61 protein [Methylomagnum ishizawai]SMF97484.1 Protein of unknown function [Methylomagnum ishizawai]
MKTLLSPLIIGNNNLVSSLLFPSEPSKRPLPLIAPDICPQWFSDRHSEVFGWLPPLGVHRLTNCLVIANGMVINEGGELVYSPDIVSPFWTKKLDRYSIETIKTKEIISCDNDIIYVRLANPGFKVYGHWLLDILPSLWLFKYFCSTQSFDMDFKFVLQEGTPGWAIDIISDYFGICRDMIIYFDEANQILSIKNLIIPSYLRVSPAISPRFNDFVNDLLYVSLMNKATVTNNQTKFPKKFFILRGNGAINRKTTLDNQDSLLEILKQFGIVPFYPESLSFSDQIALFSQAELIIGEFGSALHNAVFSPDSTSVVVLANSFMNWTQSAISALRGQRLQYIKPETEQKVNSLQSYVYNIDDIRINIETVLTARSS